MENKFSAAAGTNITLNILWFSILARHRGKRSEQLSLPAGSTGSDLMERLGEEMPVIHKFAPYIRLAVNQEYASASTALNDGDEVALITPVSGG